MQFVKIGSSCSNMSCLNIGVPQGGIMSPVLFLVYINDIGNISNNLFPTLFADDTTLSLSHCNYASLVSTLNNDLKLLSEWTIANRLTINVDITELLIISNSKYNAENNEIHLNNQNLEVTNGCSFLGVKLDSGMNFSDHINFITSKLAKNTGIFYKIRDNLNIHAALSFIIPSYFKFLV